MSSVPGFFVHHSNLCDMQSSGDGMLCTSGHTPTRVSSDEHIITPSQEQIQMDSENTNSQITAQNGLPQFYDASTDRRKRRKISQEPDLDLGQTSPSRSDGKARVRESYSPKQKTESPRSRPIDPIQDIHEGDAYQDESVHLGSPIPKVRRRGRPPKTAVKGSQTTLFMPPVANGLHADERTVKILDPQGSLKKAALKIASDGNPVESSKTTSSSANSRVSTKPASGMKNLVLKNGRLAQKLIVTLRYHTLPSGSGITGRKIEDVLSTRMRIAKPLNIISPSQPAPIQGQSTSKSTHPFFLAKAIQQQTPAADNNTSLEVKKPVAWKDLTFKANRPPGTKNMAIGKPLWPPLPYQHVGVPQRSFASQGSSVATDGKHKSKVRNDSIADHENLLSLYVRDKFNGKTFTDGPTQCEKWWCTSAEALSQVLPRGELHSNIKAVSTMRAKALKVFSSFDRAEASGPYPWTQHYSPSTWDEVLQSTSHVLYEWLSGLAVHNVKQGLDQKQAKQVPKRRKRLKKRTDEFADFIDFEDEALEAAKVKNAILIVGPNGCGKTASVFSVAKELGFEVFEIHSGMRRSQKDIFEKVGDMTQNHMVQGGQNTSRDSSILHDTDVPGSETEEKHQPALTSFLVPPAKKALQNTSRSATPQPNKQSQKQSLILFEEVDHVFEDDRGFWSGVQALIQNSKRPVVMTCNDLQDVPLDELDLHTTLVYTAPHPDVVAEYLCYIAAAEGHMIRPDAVCALYESKGYDLRATITELQFWCQMTVGSTKGGLDWFPPPMSRISANLEPTVRTFSQDTFRTGLDLLPVSFFDLEEDLKYASENLSITCDSLFDLALESEGVSVSKATKLPEALTFMETRSDVECMDFAVQPLLYSTLAAATTLRATNIDRLGISKAKTRCSVLSQERKSDAFRCLDALAVENSIHSLGHSRLAPSLDSARSVLACDIAPYVRSIVNYDQRLEQQRDETFSSQGKKSRTTRAARAAAEGGDKASTRRERWFPQNLNLQAVLETGNHWPQWRGEGYMDITMEMDVVDTD